MDSFRERKEQRLQAGADRSRAGGVDPEIRALVDTLNRSERFSTTSSCSGRVLLLAGSDQTKVQKQNCLWLFVTHQKCRKEDVIAGLLKAEDNAVFKFEPFVLHVQCRTLEDAQLLAVRSTHCLEVPLCRQGTVLVSEEYIDYLVQVANQKMEENEKRRKRFCAGLEAALSAPVTSEQLDEKVNIAASVYTRRRRQRATKKERGNGGATAHSDGESDLAFLMGNT
ncbi:tRNA wybutosine-synthesizing protein 3 homolog isoform X2 [Chiloscyllium plagiosum]|uniref:tRNA wybutosine-synthesizing protein 3 homolog isoform X2 n=1 Tax=Chiloscyllium plagiosum TaxID=36176 RepID=UPI001CB806B6|nr:tRNA wybutosine-synthesizing protein 3 homolog isoform X2 [Chiloscyllium plagiosum]